ncbi:hypothetical protein [Mycobacterium kiyosense]
MREQRCLLVASVGLQTVGLETVCVAVGLAADVREVGRPGLLGAVERGRDGCADAATG